MQTHILCHSVGSLLSIASNHHQLNTSIAALSDRMTRLGTRFCTNSELKQQHTHYRLQYILQYKTLHYTTYHLKYKYIPETTFLSVIPTTKKCISITITAFAFILCVPYPMAKERQQQQQHASLQQNKKHITHHTHTHKHTHTRTFR